ncbi:MAG: mechanosensitive ion channel family protein, partial [Alphaproteobacteria bacterium]|nr:mechanosensitive ion channel family protein [Alphaproteobacteria bacterium]
RSGDWISVEGGTDGRVIELNWRATYILTARRDLAIVPNSTIAKSKIVNVSSPSGLHGTSITVQVDAQAPPPPQGAAKYSSMRSAILGSSSQHRPRPSPSRRSRQPIPNSRSRFLSKTWALPSRRRTSSSISFIGTSRRQTSIWRRRRMARRSAVRESAAPAPKGCSSWLPSLRHSHPPSAPPSQQSSRSVPMTKARR